MTPRAAGALRFRFRGSGKGHALWTSPVYSVPVRCSVSGLHSCMGVMSRRFRSRQSSMVRPSFLSLGVAGLYFKWILTPW